MSFCQKCGTQLADEARFCPSCGTAVVNQTGQTQSNWEQYQQPEYQYQTIAPPKYPPVLQNFTRKLKVKGIIWIVVASLQVVFALYYFSTGATLSKSYYYRNSAWVYFMYGVFISGVAVLNFVLASKDIKNSKHYIEEPVGIVKEYKPIGGYIGNLIYNIFLGGVIGIVGSIFGFYVRSIVTNNESEFIDYEKQYYERQNKESCQS